MTVLMRPVALYLSLPVLVDAIQMSLDWRNDYTPRVTVFSNVCSSPTRAAVFVCVQQERGNNAEDDSLSDRPEHAQLWWV